VHEIKNPLSYVQANVEGAEELLDRLSEAARSGQLQLGPELLAGGIDPQRIEEDRQALDDARGGCARLFKIIDDIKTYAHPGQARRDWADINRLVDVSLTLAGSELRRFCKVQKSFARLPEVLCDGAKISQVILNLLVNAAQAIEKDAKASGRVGQIDVGTRLVDGAVRITVKDDGPGMEPEVLRKIFLPFFTTKPAGVGTGLGLAISRRLMESQGGTIEVESEPGRGANFTVVLPVQPPADDAASSAAK
jgi:signal transduction histidine kinase